MPRSRRWQVFAASSQVTTLPTNASPWHLGHQARLPLEHWAVILDFAASTQPTLAQHLERWSSSGKPTSSLVDADENEVWQALSALEVLIRQINEAPPLAPVIAGDILETYPNTEHVRMLEAVGAVLRVCVERHEPFMAWID